MLILWSTLRPVSLFSTLPTGGTQVGTVPFFNVWTIWWNADRATRAFSGYWHAPIFFPASGTFAFSEPQPATLMVAPLVWLSGSPVLAYKVYLLASLVLNGIMGMLLLRRLSVRRLSAALGGVLIVLLPIVHQQIDVLQLIPVWGILWTWLALDAFCGRPSPGRALQAGLAFGLSFWLSIHHALFLSVLLCGPVLLLPRNWKSSRMWGWAPLALGIALILILPVILPIRHYLKQYRFERSDRTVTALSALPVDYLQPPTNAWLSGPRVASAKRELLVGWLKLTLAAVGVWAGLRRRRTRCLGVFLSLTAALAFTLSLGAHLQWGEWSLWAALCRGIPGLMYVRSVFRFAYFVQLVLVIFAVLGADFLLRTGLLRCRWNRVRWLLPVGSVLVLAAAAAETPPADFILAGVPDRAINANWIAVVRQHLTPGHSLLCLPFAPGLTVRDLDVSSRWMYLQTQHGLPMVNGYSGFFPKSWFQLQASLTNNGSRPAPPLEQLLRQGNVELIVVQGNEPNIDSLRTRLAFQAALDPLFTDATGITVLRLRWLTPAASSGR